MKAVLLSLLLVALGASPVQAMTWGELEAEINSVESGGAPDSQLILRFAEMVHMLVSYTRSLHQAELTPLFCPPQGEPMHSDQLVSIVRAQARRDNAGNETLVQDLLLAGFQRQFPCP